MEYLASFHWWYIPLGLFFLILFFGKGKGGIVKERFTAKMEVLDERFRDCRPEADYCIFKEGEPHHIDIEIDNLPLEKGEELRLWVNERKLALVKVKANREAEFDHWSDEDVQFPVIREGDELAVSYEEEDVLKGVFYRDK